MQSGRANESPQPEKTNIMQTRNVLYAAASLAADAGAGLAVAGGSKLVDSARESAAPRPGPYIESSDGTRLFCKEWGTGKPVLFVHSWAVNSELWQYQMIHLASQGMRCIAYDTRGHGRSSDPGRGYDFDTLADDLNAVIQAFDLRDTAIVGHSIGCSTIVRYLSRYGADRISRAALLAPTMPFMLKTDDNPEGIERSVFEQVRAAFMKDFPKWLGENARPFFVPETSTEMVNWAVNMCLQSSLKAIVDLNRVEIETDFREELKRVRVPTLVIHGDKDHSAPLELTGRRTALLIPGCQFKVYEDAPHGLMFTHVDRLNGDLSAFFG